ncbi:MAG: hypothetical protein KDA72_01235 [Planctomycetales bacterium]|nr:hypothetical protein [Planctomycetales bacterium]
MVERSYSSPTRFRLPLVRRHPLWIAAWWFIAAVTASAQTADKRLADEAATAAAMADRSAASTASQESESQRQAHIASLIEQLGDNNYHRRSDAKWELERIGLAAFEQLRQAAEEHTNAHVARAARYLIESQNVVWWLETDSLEVRELLKSYNESTGDDRDTVLLQLSERSSPDALLALCRLARFESHELRSKSAALYLMQAISKQLKLLAPPSRAQQSSQLVGSIALTLGDSRRVAAQWLQAFIDDLQNSSKLETGPVADSHLARWQELVTREQELATTQPQAASQRSGHSFEHMRTRAVTLRLYRWLGSWITEHYGREPALALVRSSLELVGNDPQALLTAAAWAIEAELPELVPELAAKYADQFKDEPQLGYYLAESYLQLGDESSAQKAADAASEAIVKQVEQLKALTNLNLEEIRANRHYQHARLLAQRGLFPWAEQEYLRALALESRVQAGIRADLAQFYWFGGENAKAAETLRPLAEEAQQRGEPGLPMQADVYSNPAAALANYHFYSGLAALDENKKPLASEHLRKSLEVGGVSPNPDVVIALQQLGSDEPFHSYFQMAFEEMSGDFRIRVLEAEEQLSKAADRMSRAMSGPRLAEECNQLAWLLSKCEISTSEALSLSLRSLELMPDEPVYLDTLARCYFADGQLEDAVRTQKKAIRLAPHERQMLKQLHEFEAALEAKTSNAVP